MISVLVIAIINRTNQLVAANIDMHCVPAYRQAIRSA